MKKFFSLFLFSGAMAFMTVSCSSNKNALSSFSVRGEWNILQVNGNSVKADVEPFVGFNLSGHSIYGNTGCNSFKASLDDETIKSGKMSFGAIGSTRMMCRDMATEQNIMKALSEVAGYVTVPDSPDKMVLVNKDGKQIMLLQKRESKPVSLSDLSGEWSIRSAKWNGAEVALEASSFLGFDIKKKMVYGNAGCNSLNGKIVHNRNVANSIAFNNVACTMMLCHNEKAERAILNCLDAARSFTREADGNIILLDDNGTELLVLAKK